MSLNTWEVRSANPDVVSHVIHITGAGTSVPTMQEPSASAGIAIARTSAGFLTFTWTDEPGNFLGCTFGFGGTTSANMAGHTAVFTSYASKVLTVKIYDAADAIDDLELTEFLCINAMFKRTNV